MAITYVEIDTSMLQTDIKELEENIVRVQSSLEGLKTELNELNTYWQGSANIVFRAQVSKDYSFMEEVLQEMNKLKECMVHAGREYGKCEEEVLSTVNNIRI